MNTAFQVSWIQNLGPKPFSLKEHRESGLLLSPQSKKSHQKILFPFPGSPPFNRKQHSSIYLQIHIIASSTTSSTTTVASSTTPHAKEPSASYPLPPASKIPPPSYRICVIAPQNLSIFSQPKLWPVPQPNIILPTACNHPKHANINGDLRKRME